jgi:hypothetical protein
LLEDSCQNIVRNNNSTPINEGAEPWAGFGSVFWEGLETWAFVGSRSKGAENIFSAKKVDDLILVIWSKSRETILFFSQYSFFVKQGISPNIFRVWTFLRRGANPRNRYHFHGKEIILGLLMGLSP